MGVEAGTCSLGKSRSPYKSSLYKSTADGGRRMALLGHLGDDRTGEQAHFRSSEPVPRHERFQDPAQEVARIDVGADPSPAEAGQGVVRRPPRRHQDLGGARLPGGAAYTGTISPANPRTASHPRCRMVAVIPRAPFDVEVAEPAADPVAVGAAVFLPQQRQRLGAARYGYAPTPAANRGASYPAGANGLRADAASPSTCANRKRRSPARIVDNAPRLTHQQGGHLCSVAACLEFRTLYVGHHET